MILIIFWLNAPCVSAQPEVLAEGLQSLTTKGSTLKHLVFASGKEVSYREFVSAPFRKKAGLPEQNTWITKAINQGSFGQRHIRLQQAFKGRKIIGAEYLLHESEGFIKKANGHVVLGLQLDAEAGISESLALKSALDYLPAQSYAWEEPAYEALLKEMTNDPEASFEPHAELVIVAKQEEPIQYVLAYEFDIFATAPYTRKLIYVDAHNGGIVLVKDKAYRCDVPGTGSPSCFNGPMEITTDSCGGPFFRLRSAHNTTYNAHHTNSNPTSDFVDEDNIWGEAGQQNGIDVHWASQQFYNYFEEEFNWQGINGEGMKLLAWANFGTNYAGAFWLGNWANFGGGDGVNWRSMTSLDIVVHEFIHGIIQYSSGLENYYEAGAINEALCDFFASVLEHRYHPDGGNWNIGECADISFGAGIRSLSNPNANGDPDTYQGGFWVPQENCLASLPNDFCGVHSNSTVISHFFYLLSEGGVGANDFGNIYNLEGIGLEKAAQLAFHLMVNYLTPTSSFFDFRRLAFSAANDIPGFGTFEQEQLAKAFCAAGLGSCEPEASTLLLATPNGGEAFQHGERVPVRWDAEGNIDLLKLQYSINGGTSWVNIADSVENTGMYEWTIPNAHSYQCRVRILARDNPLAQDQSDNNFAIFGCNAIAHFEVNPGKICLGQPLIATNTSSGLAGEAELEFEWEIDGETVSSNPNGITHYFTSPGMHLVTLYARLDDNCIDTFSRQARVFPEPSAEFSLSAEGLALHLHALDEDATAFIWTLNGLDLNISQPNFTTTVEAEGQYQLCLFVIGLCGNSPEACQTIEITQAEICEGNEPGWRQAVNGNHIIDIAEDSLFIWIATDVGVARWNKADNVKTHYNIYNSALDTDQLTALEVGADGLVWVGTRNQGLFLFDGALWVKHTIFNSDWLPDNWIKEITADASGNIWIGTNNGLVKYDGLENQAYYSFDGLPSNSIEYIETDDNSTVWVATIEGLSKLQDGTWTTYTTSNSPLPFNAIRGITVDSAQGIWMITYPYSGLIHFDGVDNWELYNTDNTPDLITNNMNQITIDHLGHIWAGTVTTFNGSLRYPLLLEFNGAEFTTYNPGLNERVDFTKFHIGTENTFWIGSEDGLIKKTDESWSRQNVFGSSLPSNIINDFVIDREGDKWLGTNKGLVKISHAGWTIFNSSNSGLSSDFVYAITIDPFDNIWVGTDKGVVRYNGNTWLPFYLSNSSIRDIEIAPDGAIWFGGTRDFGYPAGDLAVLFKLENGLWTEFSAFSHDLGNASQVKELEFDESGKLWVGTYRNPNSFPGNDYRVFTFDGEAFHQMIYGYVRGIGVLKADTANHMWVGMTGSLLGGFPGEPILYKYKDTLLVRSYSSIYAEDIKITDNHEVFFGASDHIFQLDSLGNVEDVVALPAGESSEIRQFDIDATGSIWVVSKGLRIYETSSPAIAATFYQNTENICASQTVTFLNTTSGASDFLWKINGDTVSTSVNLHHQFPEPGNFTVSLLARNNNGCEAQSSQLITVYPTADSLPLAESVSVCDGSTVLEAAPGMADYEWRLNNVLVSNNQTAGATSSGLYQLTVTDHCGGTAMAAIPVLLDPSCVWPGDANQDNIANHYDLLKIGQAYGFHGFARQEASATWVGHPAFDWGGFFPENINLKHADMNGDGLVDNADFFVLEQNYGLTHGIPAGNPSPAISPISLKPVIAVPPTQENGWQMEIAIQIQNAENEILDNIYGVAFNLYYYFPEIELDGPPSVNFGESGLGIPWVDVLSISRPSQTEPVIEAAVTRINHQNHIGTNTIGNATFYLVIDDNLAIDDTLTLSLDIQGTLMVTNDGSIIPVGANSLQFNLTSQGISSSQETLQEGSFLIYPNPGKGIYFLETKGIPARKIAVYNHHGTEVWADDLAGQGFNPTIDIQHLPGGVYWVAFYTSRGREVRKIVKL
ncbi:MAG: M4 family metallopeptidase [Lewinellaceae bacterium]|nr:M4 family metallopeptidase [Lewinellaceae bacterium]